MPIRGETIGTAYVRVLADGSGLDDSLEEQLREHSDAFEAAGRRDSEAYAAAFEEGMHGPSGKKLSAALNFAIAEQDLTNDYFNSDTWRDFEKSLNYRYGEAGRVAAAQFSAEFRKKGNLVGVEEAVLDITPRIVKATEAITAAEQKQADAREKAASDREKQTADFMRELDKISAASAKSLTQVEQEFRKARIASDDARLSVVQYAESYRDYNEAEKAVKKLNDQHKRGIGLLRQTERRFEALSEPVGRLFGRGSRNNALNFFGSVITNVLKLGSVVFRVFNGVFSVFRKAISAASTFFSTFADGLRQGSGALASFSAALGTAFTGGTLTTIATGGLNVAVALGAMAVAMGLVVFTAGTLVSILVLLSGVLVALTSTIAYGLTAAVAALGSILLPLVAVFGGLVAAIFAFNDATGDLKKSLKSVEKTAKGLFDTFKDRLFKNATEDVERFNKILGDLDPLVDRVARGFKRFTYELLRGLEDPAFGKFVQRFERFLPQAMKSLGTISTNVLAGMGGLFRAMIPLANDFLGWLEKITGAFADFTNSKKGRQEIKAFLEDAKESAKSLGRFLEQAGGLIGDLLGAGKDTGDSLFDSMARSLEKVRNYLEENPDAVRRFFSDAKGFAEDLGGAIESVVKAIKKIDSPETRQAARGFIRALGGLIEFAGTVIVTFAQVARSIVKVFQTITVAALTAVEAMIGAFAKLPGPLGASARAAQKPFAEFKTSVLDNFNDVGKGLGELEQTAAKFNPSLSIDTSQVEQALYSLRAKFYELMSLFRGAQSQANSTPTPQSPQTAALDERATASRSNGRTIIVEGITVMSPQADPAAVAQEMLNGLVGIGY